jgi:hypothetical protein
MDKVKYTFYDLMGYFIPGSLVLWLFAELLNLMNFDYSFLLIINVHITIKVAFLIIISYSVGHLLHGIANLTIDKLPSGSYPPKSYFPEQFYKDFDKPVAKKLFEQIRKKFQIKDKIKNDLVNLVEKSYWLCFSYVSKAGKDTLTQTFLSISGFYRGLATGFYLMTICYLLVFLYTCTWLLLIIAVSCLIAGVLFFLRNVRFKNYLTKTVYSEFLTLTENKK